MSKLSPNFITIHLFTALAVALALAGLAIDNLESLGYNKKVRGLFSDNPHSAFAFGVLYFIGLTLCEIFVVIANIFIEKSNTVVE